MCIVVCSEWLLPPSASMLVISVLSSFVTLACSACFLSLLGVVDLTHFEMMRVVGRGGFGKVSVVALLFVAFPLP